MVKNKRKLSFDEVFKKIHYRSIIELLWYYQNKEDIDMKTGLRQRHFRYALMSNPKINQQKIEEVKEYFQRPYLKIHLNPQHDTVNYSFLDFLWKHEIVKRDCADSRQKICNYLTYLFDRGILDKSGKFPDVRYKLNEKYFELVDKKSIQEWIKKWNHTNLITDYQFYEHVGNQEKYRNRISLDEAGSPLALKTTKSEYSEFSYLSSSNWFLCGFTSELMSNLTQEEKNKLNQCMINIEKNLSDIMKMKFSKSERNHKKWMGKNKKNKSDDKNNLIKAVTSDTIGFYYNGKKSLVSNDRIKGVNEIMKIIKQ